MITELETKGFTVVNNFLSSDEITFILEEYTKNINNHNKKYNLPISSRDVGLMIKPKIDNILNLINQQTSLRSNVLLPYGMFINTQFISFDWHQDHEYYYLWQHHYDSLNVYLPLIKPNKNQTGLSIVPMDTMITLVPEYMDNLIDKGAKRFQVADGKTTVIDDVNETETVWNFDINNFSISPDLVPGDLLLLRGDVIHKTQDLNTDRLSLSFRCFNRDAIISKKELDNGGDYKKKFIKNNSKLYNLLNTLFENSGTGTITAKELFLTIEQHSNDNTTL
jgi:hypothetical protein